MSWDGITYEGERESERDVPVVAVVVQEGEEEKACDNLTLKS